MPHSIDQELLDYAKRHRLHAVVTVFDYRRQDTAMWVCHDQSETDETLETLRSHGMKPEATYIQDSGDNPSNSAKET